VTGPCAARRKSAAAGQVRFHYWAASDQGAAEFGKADVLVLPSLAEGLWLVTVEALRAGLAFVASQIPGIADVVVDGQNGILCDLNDAASFATAIASLIEDRGKLHAMQIASSERASQFGTAQMVDAYEKVLCCVAKGSAYR
jgi:glycosyltransferase involved in cell wall biosynthesis